MTNDQTSYIKHFFGSSIALLALTVVLATLIDVAMNYTGSCGWILTEQCSRVEYLKDSALTFAALTSYVFIVPIFVVQGVTMHVLRMMRKPATWTYAVVLIAIPLVITLLFQILPR